MRLAMVLGTLGMGCGSPVADEVPIRRLTPTEYNHTVRDLLGFGPDDWYDEAHPFDEESPPPWPFAFAPDVPLAGFEGMAEGQIASAVYVEQIERAAAHFATYGHRSPSFWVCAAPDRLEPDARRSCARDSVRVFAQRAWRRPLLLTEAERIAVAFDAWDDEYGTDVAITATLQGILQSPAFLYLPEASGRKGAVVDDFALASRMSYFLWDSMPDTALFEQAAQGDLRRSDQVRGAGARMLADPRAREMVAHFHRQWLELDALQTQRLSFETYGQRYATALVEMDPLYAAEVWSGVLNGTRAALLEEVDLFVEHTIFDGEGTLSALLTSNRGWVADVDVFGEVRVDTGAVYGASVPVDGPVRRFEQFDGNFAFGITLSPVAHPPDERAGVLTLGAVLAARAHPVHPAPIQRGVFVLDRLLCQSLGAPPDGAALTSPAEPDAQATNRERVEALTSEAPCSACHDAINPIGFAFESFDSFGGWRDSDAGRPVDTSGELRIPGQAATPIDGATTLAQSLATSDRVHDCYATHWARVATSDPHVALDDPRFAEVRQRFRGSGDIQELLLDLVSSAAFRERGGAL